MKTPLFKCRKDEGISLDKLASIVGSSVSTVHRLERGISNSVSGCVCHRLIEHYGSKGLTLDHLIYPHHYQSFSITKK